MKKVYFSSAITGKIAVSENFQINIINHMKQKGFKVLSEHVGLQNDIDIFKELSKNSGRNIPQRNGFEKDIREVDLSWVDEADYFVGIVDGPSFGVGIEIEHAILKPARGLPQTKILCLVHENNFAKLTAMIKGIRESNFQLSRYSDEQNAISIIDSFLK